jgi:serine O-acetyltransferase
MDVAANGKRMAVTAMTPNERPSSDDLWRGVRREAEMAVTADPVFGGRLTAAILDHADLGGAVAFQIGERLGKTEAERAQFARIAREAFLAAPDLVEAASRDLSAIAIHDPAVTELLAPLLNFKGFVALQAFRVSHWLWTSERTDLALLLQSESADTLQVSIHPSVRIGTAVFLDHATAIVVGAFAEIGDEVTILHNVTIGRKGTPAVRAPRIGRGVYLSAGSTMLGDIAIGDFAKIGAGALVTSDVPAGCTAVGVPARLVNCPEESIVA